MRRLALLGLALGAAAVLGVPSVRAGEPSAHKHKHLCPKCAMAEAMKKNGGQPIVVDSQAMPAGVPCAMCQAQGGAIAPGGYVVDGPGMASLGGEVPGYATLGGPAHRGFSTEPLPIGVAQMSHAKPADSGVQRTSMDPTHGMKAAGMRPGMMGPYPGGMAAQPGPVNLGPDGPGRRPRVLGHLLGLDGFGHFGEARAARRAEQHAMIPVGQPAPARVGELPASMVYQR